MKKNKKSNVLFYTLVSGCVIATSLGLILHKKNMLNFNEENSSISYEEGDNTGSIFLNYSKIQSRKIGDEFTLIATINENASFQSVTFEISDSSALEIIKKTSTSITLKRTKDFEDYITITVKSDDPFVNETETCQIRCYNNLTRFVGLFVNKISDSSTDYPSLSRLCDEDEVILKHGLKYDLDIICESTFSYLNGEYGYDGNTQILIEDDTISTLKISLKNLFNNEITSISQDLYETDYNTINFSFTYNNEINFSSNTISKKLVYESASLTINLKQYVAQSFLLNMSGIQVI